jgi:hypothetical protein
MIGKGNLRKRHKSEIKHSQLDRDHFSLAELNELEQINQILENEGLENWSQNSIEDDYLDDDFDEETMERLDEQATQMIKELEKVPQMVTFTEPLAVALPADQPSFEPRISNVFGNFQKVNQSQLNELVEKNKVLSNELLQKQGELTYSKNRIFKLNDLNQELRNKLQEKSATVSKETEEKVKRLTSSLEFKDQEIIRLRALVSKHTTLSQSQVKVCSTKLTGDCLLSKHFMDDCSTPTISKKMKRFPKFNESTPSRCMKMFEAEDEINSKQTQSIGINTDENQCNLSNENSTRDDELLSISQLMANCSLMQYKSTSDTTNKIYKKYFIDENAPENAFEAFTMEIIVLISCKNEGKLMKRIYQEIKSLLSNRACEKHLLNVLNFCNIISPFRQDKFMIEDQNNIVMEIFTGYSKNSTNRLLKKQFYLFIKNFAECIIPDGFKIVTSEDIDYIGFHMKSHSLPHEFLQILYSTLFALIDQNNVNTSESKSAISLFKENLDDLLVWITSETLVILIRFYHTLGQKSDDPDYLLDALSILYYIHTEKDDLPALEFIGFNLLLTTIYRDSKHPNNVIKSNYNLIIEKALAFLTLFQ